MDDQAHPEIIIIKRRASQEEEFHGGAWKIAFADFMTAMMAFFLVLWIINATDKNTKTIIARYFNPVKLEESARTPKNIHGDEITVSATDVPDAKHKGATGADGPQDSKKTSEEETRAAQSGDGPLNKGADQSARQGNGAAADAVDPANPKPTMSEGALFSDPYRSLDAIAGPSSPNARAIAESERVKSASEQGSADPDVFRDPFRPIGREIASEAPNPGAVKPPPPPPAGEDAKPATAAPAALGCRGPRPRSVSSGGCRACSSSAAGRWGAPCWAACSAPGGRAPVT